MARAPAARQLGDAYQARLFWYHACTLFFSNHQVARVGFEVDEALGFDDVAVYYSAPQPDVHGGHVLRDYYQSKFHVAQTGSFGYESLITPSFIGTSKASILQRLKSAIEESTRLGVASRYTLVSPWIVHPDDALADISGLVDSSLRLGRLSEGKTERSTMGAVRAAWRRHLELSTDDELLKLLSAFRLDARAWSFDGIRTALEDRLWRAGFRTLDTNQISFQYDDLIQKAFQAGTVEFDRASLKDLAQQEGLWVGPPASPDDGRKVIAVRSFTRWTNQIADSADRFLDLVEWFRGRPIASDELWSAEVWPRLSAFLESAIEEGASHDLHIDAHTTIAFAAGYALAKAPVAIVPIQRTGPTSTIRWEPSDGQTANPKDPLWMVEWQDVDGGDPGHLAVAISVTRDVSDDVATYLAASGSSVGRILVASPPGGISQRAVRDGEHAWSLAEALAQVIRKERSRRAPGSPVHLFIAAPNAFTFFLGRQATALGPCQLYEYDFDSSELGAYQPSLQIGPRLANHPSSPKEGPAA